MTTTSSNAHAWRKRGLYLALASLILIALFYAYRPQALSVEVATATAGQFEQTLREEGQLRLKHRYTIHAPVSGSLARPTIRVGDAVQRDQVLAVITPAPAALLDPRTHAVLAERARQAEAAVRAADAQLAQSLVAWEQTRADVLQARELTDQGFTSRSAADGAERQARQAEQAVTHARAHLDAARFAQAEARAALATSPGNRGTGAEWTVRSPIDGRVFQLHVDSAGPVPSGQPLMVIGDPAQMEAVIDVLSTEVIGIRPQAPVQLTLGRQIPPLQGRVQRVEPVAFTKTSALGIEERRVHVVVDVDWPAEGFWGEGFRVDAQIQLYAHDDALMIPTGALVRHGTGWQVFVVEGDRASARSVGIRDRQATHAWIADGLQPGEQVILFPGSLIQDGQRVRTQARP